MCASEFLECAGGAVGARAPSLAGREKDKTRQNMAPHVILTVGLFFGFRFTSGQRGAIALQLGSKGEARAEVTLEPPAASS
jgi:hypothetical protein